MLPYHRRGRLAAWLVGLRRRRTGARPARGARRGDPPAEGDRHRSRSNEPSRTALRGGRGRAAEGGTGVSRRAPVRRTSAEWLARLLNLVPYLLARPGIRIADAAADLGVSERQLRDDLELLWVCGLPGYGPGDLIDMAFDGDRVTITYDAGIDRPLRLTPDEALALVVALRMLAETPGAGRPGRDRPGAGQDRDAAGDAPARRWRCGCPADPDRLAAVRERGAAGGRCGSPTTRRPGTATSERVVDPMRVVVVGGHGYLEAWCRSAGAVRRFRVDRIDALHVLDEPAAPPPQAQAAPIVSDGVFQPGPDLPLVTLRVGRRARWITEYYPCERVRGVDRGGGWCRCGPPTWPGRGGWCWAWARTSPWWPRRAGRAGARSRRRRPGGVRRSRPGWPPVRDARPGRRRRSPWVPSEPPSRRARLAAGSRRGCAMLWWAWRRWWPPRWCWWPGRRCGCATGSPSCAGCRSWPQRAQTLAGRVRDRTAALAASAARLAERGIGHRPGRRLAGRGCARSRPYDRPRHR